jgi:hypothetical protein
MAERSRYQQNIIRNYYENRDTIALQRAQELVTELYLSEGKTRQRHWKNLAGHLEKLGVEPATITRLIERTGGQPADPRGQEPITLRGCCGLNRSRPGFRAAFTMRAVP